MLRRIILTIVVIACFGTAAQAEKLNVLLVMSDDLNNYEGTYGHPVVQTPNLDRLAARGVRFDRAYCQYPQCTSSRSSMLTGMYPDQIGVRRNGKHFRDNVPNTVTLPQLFRQNDYFVARVGKIYHYGVPTQIGEDGLDDPASWDEVVNPRGRDRDDEPLIYTIDRKNPTAFGGTLSWLAADGEDSEQTDAIGATECIRLLREHHTDPFFVAMGFYRPHTPFVAPKKYFEMYPIEQIRSPAEPLDALVGVPLMAWVDRPYQLQMDELEKRQAIQAYYASITFMDAQLGRVLDEVDRLDLWKNTLIVFVSDHGYHMGEHSLWQKTTLFENSSRVPMVVYAPGFESTAGKPTKALAEMLDIYRTAADFAGLKVPSYVQGRSLRAQLADVDAKGHTAAMTTFDSSDRTHRPVLWPKTKGYTIRTDRYRYTEWGGGKYGVELYDHEADPQEFTNLSQAPHMQETVAAMEKLMAEKLKVATKKP
jgi:iduronate 2-sulfatase